MSALAPAQRLLSTLKLPYRLDGHRQVMCRSRQLVYSGDFYMTIAPLHTNLMSLLTPKQFRTAILITIGLTNAEIAEFLGTTEHVVKNILRAIYDRVGCWNRVELALRFVCESESSKYDQNKIRSEVAELETRASQILHSRPWQAIMQA
jgi:DNA-binding CsgD family transcriptional regulator